MTILSQLLNHKCGANVSLLSAHEMGTCFSLQAFTVGCIVSIILALFVTQRMITKKLDILSGVAVIVMSVMFTVLIGRLIGTMGRQKKKTQEFELERLKEKGVSETDAIVAVFNENA